MLPNSVLRILLLFAAFISISFADSDVQSFKINLTEAEKQWLQSQSEIHLSMVDNQEPVVFKDYNGEIRGIFPDYVNILERTIGKKIRISVVSENPVIVHERAHKLGLHGTFALFKTPANNKLFLYSKSYFSSPLFAFTSRNQRLFIKNISDLQHKRVAVLEGHQMMKEYARNIADVTLINASSPKQQMELLQYGEVDVVLGYLTYHHLIRKHLFDNIVPAFSSDTDNTLHMGILPEYPQLLAIFNKAIASIPASSMNRIVEKWLNKATVDETVGLSQKERNWIKEKHLVRARVSYWPPYMFSAAEPLGVAVDYLRFVAERYNIDVQFIPDKSGWVKSINDLKTDRKHYDLILTMNPTPERQVDYALSEPYLKMPWVIFMKSDSEFVANIDDLNGQTVAVERGFVMQKKLQTLYPKIILNVVDSSLAALQAVSTGKSAAYIGNLANSTYLIREYGLTNLKVAAPTPFENHMQSMAVRKDWPELASIITKAISQMTQQEHDKIKNKWLSVRYEHGINYWNVFFSVISIILIAGTIILIIIKVNNKLNREINQRIKTEEKLEEYLNVVDDNIIISTTDKDGVITKVSEAFCRVSQYSREELEGNTLALVRHPDTPDTLFKNIWQVISSKNIWTGEIKNRTKHNDEFWVYASISPVMDKHNIITGYTCIYQDISDKKRVEQLSITDKLTGLYNRFKLDEVLSHEALRSERYANQLSVVIIDIDFFKSVNDNYGHQIGDKVLVLFAQLVKNSIRSTDIAGRWGGEEFVVICPQTDAEGAMSMFEKMRADIEEYKFDRVGKITASIGITSYINSDTPETLINRADTALYQAKNTGRNRVIFY